MTIDNNSDISSNINLPPTQETGGFVTVMEAVLNVCAGSAMGVRKANEVKTLLDRMHAMYTGAQEDLCEGQRKLIKVMEEHGRVKEEISRINRSGMATGLGVQRTETLGTGGMPSRPDRDGTLIWVTGGDIREDRSTEHRLRIVGRIGCKAEVVVLDSFFAKDGRLGIRVAEGDVGGAVRAAVDLGYEGKSPGSFEPELFIREVGSISEQTLKDAIGEECTAVYKRGLNAFVRVKKCGTRAETQEEDVLSML
ncbi:hypothetical protein Pmar_PMAR027063 [Perkinsus marinus ATCC 50983]|uniref:Uncharacterized protein n=1 Tax=Perkinsus marinus (strain ATCC 50983 / TXsc) TaxID=423536 RepID=C5KMF6_PERM5|nr:hypothetical protein Pmar_PMAR027063 [Perkinsus marinus ATCC 50983]EER14337.1 hypothetical protein Pmar_PMAR027063 [Perkinsus marinus ATCC 50983]|eukprot:XP_002782542.1 hypothetical protein Pmar_PMAR027063 [Perkinsus marinus ATCC 50983]